MKVTLCTSLVLNVVLMGCLFLYYDQHKKDQLALGQFSGMIDIWKNNAYTALGLARTCWENKK